MVVVLVTVVVTTWGMNIFFKEVRGDEGGIYTRIEFFLTLVYTLCHDCPRLKLNFS
jgi:hypothetical protein